MTTQTHRPSYASATQSDSFTKKGPSNHNWLNRRNSNKTIYQCDSNSHRPIADQVRIKDLKQQNMRICRKQKTADDLIDNHKCITIENSILPIRRLISRNKRIILSNVCPIIPHSEIKELLKDKGVELVSPITFIKAGFSEPYLAHVLSFRWQAYITPEDENKLPDAIQLKFDDTQYWIYISPESNSCFLCKKDDHMAKNGPNSKANRTEPETPQPSQKEFQPPRTPSAPNKPLHLENREKQKSFRRYARHFRHLNLSNMESALYRRQTLRCQLITPRHQTQNLNRNTHRKTTV